MLLNNLLNLRVSVEQAEDLVAGPDGDAFPLTLHLNAGAVVLVDEDSGDHLRVAHLRADAEHLTVHLGLISAPEHLCLGHMAPYLGVKDPEDD